MIYTKPFPLKLEKLNWFYDDKKILDNIDFSFEKNKFYSILGPNGSGKTTLLKNILRSLDTNRNCVFVEDIDILKYKSKELAKKLSYVAQSTTLDFEFSALYVVLMGRFAYIKRFSSESDEDMRIVKDAMLSTNTWHLKDINISNLSGGEQQRVLVARAIAQDTEVILLDEPISHLDIYQQVELLDTLKSIKKSKTIITVLHDLNLAAQYSDTLILISNGSIVAYGTAKEVITEKNLMEVYHLKSSIIEDPSTGKPHIIPSMHQ